MQNKKNLQKDDSPTSAWNIIFIGKFAMYDTTSIFSFIPFHKQPTALVDDRLNIMV